MKDGSLLEYTHAAAHIHGAAMTKLMAKFHTAVVGKRIKRVGYVVMSGELYPCLVLDDAVETAIIAQRDDECNGPGVLHVEGENNDASSFLCECSLKPETKPQPKLRPTDPKARRELVVAIGEEFGRALLKEIGDDRYNATVEANRNETAKHICHSHDHCDANMVMDEAWRKIMGRASLIQDDYDAQLWSDAWGYWKQQAIKGGAA